MTYTEWLVDIIGGVKRKDMWRINHLLEEEFTYRSRTNDMNRAYDGLQLRELYLEETGKDSGMGLDTPCSWLEMMIALCMRAADLMDYESEIDTTGDYFWLMMANSGLDKAANHEIMDDILWHLGGDWVKDEERISFFTVPAVPANWNKMEIWAQLNWYLTSEYYKQNEQK